MSLPLAGLAGSPWLLLVVAAVAGLDAVLPFMPSESTVVAVAVLSAGTGRPNIALLVVVAAIGAYAGDRLAYHIGRGSTRAVVARLDRGHRSKQLHEWVHRLLHSRGALVIVFARYVPGGRSTTAFAAGVVGYPLRRFRLHTGIGVLVWALEAALLGYVGGTAFADRPLLGLAVAWSGALVVTGIAIGVHRVVDARAAAAPVSSAPSAPTSPEDPGTPDPAPTRHQPVP